MRHPSSFLASVVLISALAAAVPAAAQIPAGGGGPAVEYSADFKIQNYGPKMRGRMYGAPGRERRETPDPWGGTTLILRYDRGVVWTIYPNGGYTEFPLRPPGAAAPPPGALPPGLARIEEDDINDVPATKYAFPPSPTGPGGEVWISREGIALRVDTRPGPGVREVRFELDNVRYGPLNPGIFELPPGARRMNPPLPPMAGAPQMAPQTAPPRPPQSQFPQAQPQPPPQQAPQAQPQPILPR